MVRVLLERGAEAHVPVGKFGRTILYGAVKFSSPGVVAMLLCTANYGPVVWPDCNILTLCVQFRNDADGLKIASMLCMKKAVPVNEKVGQHEDTPLHMACRCSTPEMVVLLLHHGADVNAVNKHGSTALLLASENPEYGDVMIPLLIRHGADPEQSNRNRWTPLLMATINGSPRALRAFEPYVQPANQLAQAFVWPGRRDCLPHMRLAKRYGFDPQTAMPAHPQSSNPARVQWAAVRAHGRPVLDQSPRDPFVFLQEEDQEAIWRYIANEVGDVVHPVRHETLLHVAARTNKAFAVVLLIKRGFNPLRLTADGRRPLDLSTDPATRALLREYTCFRPTPMHARWFGPYFCDRAYTFLLVLHRWKRDKVRVIHRDVAHYILWHLGHVDEV